MAFEKHRPIKTKLYQLILKYPKFHVISRIVWCIRNYGTVVNYNTIHNKVVYKYFFKAFYNRLYKKKYNLQIWQHNVRYINIIVIKYIIILDIPTGKRKLSMDIADTTTPAEMAQVFSLVNLVRRYKWVISNLNLDVTKKQIKTDIQRY